MILLACLITLGVFVIVCETHPLRELSRQIDREQPWNLFTKKSGYRPGKYRTIERG